MDAWIPRRSDREVRGLGDLGDNGRKERLIEGNGWLKYPGVICSRQVCVASWFRGVELRLMDGLV